MLINDEQYRLCLQKNTVLEESREFCKHSFEHLLDVARLAYILLLEEGRLKFLKEVVYAAGLLHDIGRWKEYEDGTDHGAFGAELAKPILNRAGFESKEVELIAVAIASHRWPEEQVGGPSSRLGHALKKADAYARLCFTCSAANRCKNFDARPHAGGIIY